MFSITEIESIHFNWKSNFWDIVKHHPELHSHPRLIKAVNWESMRTLNFVEENPEYLEIWKFNWEKDSHLLASNKKHSIIDPELFNWRHYSGCFLRTCEIPHIDLDRLDLDSSSKWLLMINPLYYSLIPPKFRSSEEAMKRAVYEVINQENLEDQPLVTGQDRFLDYEKIDWKRESYWILMNFPQFIDPDKFDWENNSVHILKYRSKLFDPEKFNWGIFGGQSETIKRVFLKKGSDISWLRNFLLDFLGE